MTGTGSFTTTSANITLDTLDIAGAIDVTTNTSGNVSLTNTDVSGTTLAVSNVLGTLDVVSAGAIDQTGAVTATTASFNSGNDSTITLNNTLNDFNTFDVMSTGDVVQVTDTDDIDLAGMSASAMTVYTRRTIGSSRCV